MCKFCKKEEETIDKAEVIADSEINMERELREIEIENNYSAEDMKTFIDCLIKASIRIARKYKKEIPKAETHSFPACMATC